MADKIAFATDRLGKLTCPPAKDRIYYFDRRTPGLCICIFPSGAKVFYVYKKLLGKPMRQRLGRWPHELSIDDARRQAALTIADVVKGIDPRQAKRTARAELTLGELWKDFLDKHVAPKRRPRTKAEYQRQYNVYLASWKGKRLSQIDSATVQALHTRLGQQNGHYQANRVLALVHVLFAWAAKHFGWRHGNPAHDIERFPEHSRERFLRPDEIGSFFSALDGESDTIYADLFLLSLFTGARPANVRAMRWPDVNLDRCEWVIPGEQTKNGERIEIALVPEAIEALKRRRKATRGVFVFPGRCGGHVKDVNKPWQRILERAGIDNLRMHDLRRSLASWQAATGASLLVIGKTLGHKSPSASAVYARLQQAGDPVRRAIALATTAMMAAANQKGNGA